MDTGNSSPCVTKRGQKVAPQSPTFHENLVDTSDQCVVELSAQECETPGGDKANDSRDQGTNRNQYATFVKEDGKAWRNTSSRGDNLKPRVHLSQGNKPTNTHQHNQGSTSENINDSNLANYARQNQTSLQEKCVDIESNESNSRSILNTDTAKDTDSTLHSEFITSKPNYLNDLCISPGNPILKGNAGQEESLNDDLTEAQAGDSDLSHAGGDPKRPTVTPLKSNNRQNEIKDKRKSEKSAIGFRDLDASPSNIDNLSKHPEHGGNCQFDHDELQNSQGKLPGITHDRNTDANAVCPHIANSDTNQSLSHATVHANKTERSEDELNSKQRDQCTGGPNTDSDPGNSYVTGKQVDAIGSRPRVALCGASSKIPRIDRGIAEAGTATNRALAPGRELNAGLNDFYRTQACVSGTSANSDKDRAQISRSGLSDERLIVSDAPLTASNTAQPAERNFAANQQFTPHGLRLEKCLNTRNNAENNGGYKIDNGLFNNVDFDEEKSDFKHTHSDDLKPPSSQPLDVHSFKINCGNAPCKADSKYSDFQQATCDTNETLPATTSKTQHYASRDLRLLELHGTESLKPSEQLVEDWNANGNDALTDTASVENRKELHVGRPQIEPLKLPCEQEADDNFKQTDDKTFSGLERSTPRSPGILTVNPGTKNKPKDKKTLKVEFAMEDIEKNSLKNSMEKELNNVNGGKNKGTGPQRCRQHRRLSLLGKPIVYKPPTDPHYRRIQSKVYNFLERPKEWKAIIYHIFVFLMVFVCIVMTVLVTVPSLQNETSVFLFYMEIFMVLWYILEYTLRVWSAGCRSRYQGWEGRLKFVRQPFCVVDVIVITASTITLLIGTSGQVGFISILGGLRFFQLLRMVKIDRRGGTWKLLASVIWAHRQELVTTLYIGILVLIFSAFFVYLAEKEQNSVKFGTYANALWWGVITLCTVGYGDTVPVTWGGKLVAAICAMCGIAFFALPAGILGSGFALKVHEHQRKKHHSRRQVPAAMLIQAVWRCYAADENSTSIATWKPHMRPHIRNSPSSSSITGLFSKKTEKSSFVNRFSIKRKERNSNSGVTNSSASPNSPTPSPMVSRHFSWKMKNQDKDPSDSTDALNRSHMSLTVGDTIAQQTPLTRKESDEDFLDNSYTPNQRVTELTDVHKKAIRALRKIQYFVARRKFKEALRPYDIKDVLEQYSVGHADMLGRIKCLQSRHDQLLGKIGSKSKDVYDSKICLASRVVKIERKVDDIEEKLEQLMAWYEEDRKLMRASLPASPSNDAITPPPQLSPPPTGAQTNGSGEVKLKSILVDKEKQNGPNKELLKHPKRIMQKHVSDLGPRFKKRVTLVHARHANGNTTDEEKHWSSTCSLPTTTEIRVEENLHPAAKRTHSWNVTTNTLASFEEEMARAKTLQNNKNLNTNHSNTKSSTMPLTQNDTLLKPYSYTEQVPVTVSNIAPPCPHKTINAQSESGLADSIKEQGNDQIIIEDELEIKKQALVIRNSWPLEAATDPAASFQVGANSDSDNDTDTDEIRVKQTDKYQLKRYKNRHSDKKSSDNCQRPEAQPLLTSSDGKKSLC